MTDHPFYNDPGFWAFMVSIAGTVGWLIKYFFLKQDRTNIKKANLDSSVESLKTDNAIRLATTLQLAIDQMTPVLKEHSKILSGFKASFDLMQTAEASTTQMMKELKVQYGNFTSEIQKFNAIGDDILGRMKNIETEVEVLKSGNLFIKNKK